MVSFKEYPLVLTKEQTEKLEVAAKCYNQTPIEYIFHILIRQIEADSYVEEEEEF